METTPPPDGLTPLPSDASPRSTAPAAIAGSAAPNPLGAAGIWLIVLAAALLLCGLCSTLFYMVLPLTARDPSRQLEGNIVFGSSAGFGLLLGGVFIWQGIRTWRGSPSIPAARVFPPLLALLLAFVGTVLLGFAALSVPAVAVYALPPLHLLGAALPPVALLGYAARRLGRNSGLRALLVSFGWGALAATSLAFILEMMVALSFVVVAAIILVSLPNSRALVEQLQLQLEQAQRTQDLSVFTRWLSSPVAIGALLMYFAVIIPPVEESVKALVVAFIDPHRTRPGDALLWGMSAGAGFAVLESMFNGSVGVEAWAPLILMRAGAAVLHIANGATMGLGWYAARAEGRWGRLLLAYLASVLFHALWNGSTILLSTSGGTGLGIGSGFDVSTAFAVLLLLVLLVLTFVGLAWIVYAVRTTYARDIIPVSERSA